MSKILTRLPIPYEPKKVSRWVINFPKEFELPQYTLATTARPIIHFDGKNNLTYEPITTKFYDPIHPSISQRLFMLSEAYKYKKPNWLKRIINKIKGISSKPHYMYENLLQYVDGFDYELSLLDPTGYAVEKWLIRGCKILSIDFNDLCYMDDSNVLVTLTVQPKDFILLY